MANEFIGGAQPAINQSLLAPQANSGSSLGYGVSSFGGAVSTAISGFTQATTYRHKARMQKIAVDNAKIDARFQTANLKAQLADALALQNAMSTGQGRSGGSLQAIANKSITNFKQDAEMLGMLGKQKATQHQIKGIGFSASAKSKQLSTAGGFFQDLASDYQKAQGVG